MPTINDRQVIALDLGGTALRGGLVSQDGVLSSFRTVDTARERSIVAVMSQVIDLVGDLTNQAERQGLEVDKVGLALPGFVALKEQLIHFSPNFPAWHQVPVGEMLRKQLTLPLALINDGNAHALGEWWRGSARGYRNVVVLTLGTGVGGGVIVNNQLLEGSNGSGGEIGHMVVNPDGALCGCGNRGCLETVASGSALQRTSDKSAAALEQEARDSSDDAQRHFDNLGRSLGIALSSLVYIFQPEIIVLSGKLSRAFDLFAPSLHQEMRSRLTHHPSGAPPVIQSKFIDQAGLFGAALQAAET